MSRARCSSIEASACCSSTWRRTSWASSSSLAADSTSPQKLHSTTLMALPSVSVPPHSRRRAAVTALDVQQLAQPADMALLAAEPGAGVRPQDVACQLDPDHPGPHAQHVDVVVLDRLVGGVRVVHRARAHSVDLGGRDRDPGARPADQDAAVGLPLDDRAPDREGHIGIVDRLGGVGPQVDDLVALVLQYRDDLLLEREARVVEAAGDPHDGATDSLAASSAAPRTPASTPYWAARISVRVPTPASTYCLAVSSAGPMSRSPAVETPPPTTTCSGSKTLIALAIPMPRRWPSSLSRRMHSSSPSWAAATTSVPATSRSSEARRANAVPGCSRADSTARRSSARPAARCSSEPGWGNSSWAGGAPSDRSRPMIVWPSSPAAPVAPRNGRPPSTSPPPTPVPTVNITRWETTSLPAGSQASASPATLASLSTNTGSPSRSVRVARRGTPSSGRFTPDSARPVANSTAEGIPIPTAVVSGSRAASITAASWSTSARGPACSVGTICAFDSPSGFIVASETLVPPTSTPTKWPFTRAPSAGTPPRGPAVRPVGLRPASPGWPGCRGSARPRMPGLPHRPCPRRSPGTPPAGRR